MTLTSITKLVRSIQAIMSATTQPAEEELVDKAAEHEEVVEKVRERLEKVETLLHQGLRTEAIELAEQDPNLNELLTILDFPELGPWNDLLASKGIQAVQSIPVEAAAELNDAYLQTGSNEKLLQHYRTISLARAPLPKRISALRQLAERDAQNPVWQQDLREFEKFRIRELKTDLDNAIQQENLAALATLDHELSEGAWSVEVPAAIRQQARKAHETLRRRSALEELKTLAHQLSDAYAAFDRPMAQRIQQRFLAVQGIAGVASTHPLLDIAGPALDWLNEEARQEAQEAEYNATVIEIEQVLDRRTTLEELEKLYHRATRHGKSLPPVLEARMAERRDLLLSQAKRRRMLMLGSTIAACVVLIGAVAFVVQRMSFRNEVAKASGEIRKLIDAARENGQVSLVNEYLTGLEQSAPNVLSTPEILGLKQEYETLANEDRGRVEQLSAYYSSLDSLLQGSPKLSEFPAAEQTLTSIQQLCRSESEKAKHLQWANQIAAKRGQVQRAIDDQFDADLETVKAEVAKLPLDNLGPYDAVSSALSGLEGRLEVSEPIRDNARQLHAKVRQDRMIVSKNLEVAAGVQKITDAVGQAAAFEQQLTTFVAAHPGTQRVTEMQDVLKSDMQMLKSAVLWRNMYTRLKRIDLAKVGAAEAKNVIEECEQLRKDNCPFGDDVLKSELLTALKFVAARATPENTPLDAQLRAMLEKKTIQKCYMVELSAADATAPARPEERRCYYCPKEPQVKGALVTFEYFTTTTGSQVAKAKTISVSNIYEGNSKSTREAWLSPQSKMADQILMKLDANPNSDFDNTIAIVAREILNASDVDPIVRLLLLEDVLKLGAAGSKGMFLKTQTILADIPKTGVSRLTNWAIPDDDRAEDEREAAGNFLAQRQTEISRIVGDALEQTRQLQMAAIPSDLYWVGWLHRDARSEWVISLRKDLNASGSGTELCCFVPTADGSSVTKETVGQLQAGDRLTISATPSVSIAKEGRPVFLILDAN